MLHIAPSSRVAVTLLVVGCLFFPASIAYSQWRSNQAAEALCVKGNETRESVLDVFHIIKTASDDQAEPRSPAEQKRAEEFWADVDKALAPIDCP